jgi:L-asparaginase
MKLIIHGGFFSESQTNQEVKKAKQDALLEIVNLGHKYLEHHTAAQTVVYTVRLLEDCDLFNAGTGSQIQSDGKDSPERLPDGWQNAKIFGRY